jgi:hypothetical protein
VNAARCGVLPIAVPAGRADDLDESISDTGEDGRANPSQQYGKPEPRKERDAK